MIYLWISLILLAVVGIFILVRGILKKKKEARSLEFEIGPITTK